MPCLSRIRPSTLGSASKTSARRLCQVESRHDVRHVAHLGAEHFSHQRLAVLLVDDGKDGGRMRVVDEFVRQEGVQQRLDRRIGRGGVDEVCPLQRHHVLVAELVQRARLEERAHLDRRQALRLDDAHVPAAALDAEHVPLVADEVGGLGLAGGVAATMQHQAGFAAEQPRRVDAQRQIAADALLRIVGNQSFRRRRHSTDSSFRFVRFAVFVLL